MYTDRIVLYEGETRLYPIRVNLNKRPLDLSECSLSLQVRKHADDANPLIDKETSDFTMVYAAQGLVMVDLTAADLGEVGLFKGQLRVVDGDGVVRKTAIFDVEIKEAVVGRIYHLGCDILVELTASEPELLLT